MIGSGRRIKVAWTVPNGDQGWLALDRNGNGVIDDGTELFGNHTPQPLSDDPNGFRALAVYDSAEQGGNGDGVISAADSIYSRLRVWIDRNHDGVSQPDEIKTQADVGITEIYLSYQIVQRRDRYGNVFRYRSRVTGASGDRSAWDVFLSAASR